LFEMVVLQLLLIHLYTCINKRSPCIHGVFAVLWGSPSRPLTAPLLIFPELSLGGGRWEDWCLLGSSGTGSHSARDPTHSLEAQLKCHFLCEIVLANFLSE